MSLKKREQFDMLPATEKPRFTPFDKGRLFNDLARIFLHEDLNKQTHFRRDYKNYNGLMAEYQRAFKLPFEEAFRIIDSLPNSYLRYHLVVDAAGNYYEYQSAIQ
jgi:hypothetical protein